MRLSEGVEWALHSCVLLAWLEDEGPVATGRLADAYELPAAYLNKQLQALRAAGILTSTAGARGGFRLARAPEAITLLDVVDAIEGTDPAFRCQEIRQRGLGGDAPKREYRSRCAIATAMRRADVEWRNALAEQTLADVIAAAERSASHMRDRARHWYAAPA
jgi:Rrf2 family protein